MYSNLRRNIVEVWQGDTFNRSIRVCGYPLREDTNVILQVRANTDFGDNHILTFSTGDDSIIVDVDPENEHAGWITLTKGAQDMSVPPGKYVYACQFIQDGGTYTLFHGNFLIQKPAI